LHPGWVPVRRPATGVVTGASIGSINSSFAHNAFGELSSLRTDAAEGALLSQILSQVLSRDRLGRITALIAAPKIAAAIVAAARWLVLAGAKRGATKGAAAMTTKQAAQVLKRAPGNFPNMPAFGKAVGWGRNGGEVAFARAGSITKAEAQSLGITSSEAFAIRDAYRAVINSSKGAANPTALGREALMNRVGQLLQ